MRFYSSTAFFVIPKDSALILYACSLRIQKTNNVTSCMSQNDVPAAAPYYLSCSLPSIYRIIGGWAGVLAINLRDLYELRPVQKEVGCWLAQCQDVQSLHRIDAPLGTKLPTQSASEAGQRGSASKLVLCSSRCMGIWLFFFSLNLGAAESCLVITEAFCQLCCSIDRMAS